MPKECLPTFNSCAIELHMHKIEGLSEHFVYFNDDIIINSHIDPDYFFRDGLPCDINKETCFNVPIYTQDEKFHWDAYYADHISLGMDIKIIWQTIISVLGRKNINTEQSYKK